MITLHAFGASDIFDGADPSPFVTKAHYLLAMSGLPYQIVSGDPRKAPKGKLPYIEVNGRTVGDSYFIQRLLETEHGIDFSNGYSGRELAVGLAFEKLCEDHLYWITLSERWDVNENYNRGAKHFFANIPMPMRPLIEAMVRRAMRKSGHAHGMGRHSREERMEMARKDIDAIAAFLYDKEFLLGKRPCASDASVAAAVEALCVKTMDTPLKAMVAKHPNLKDYCVRMRSKFLGANKHAADSAATAA